MKNRPRCSANTIRIGRSLARNSNVPLVRDSTRTEELAVTSFLQPLPRAEEALVVEKKLVILDVSVVKETSSHGYLLRDLAEEILVVGNELVVFDVLHDVLVVKEIVRH